MVRTATEKAPAIARVLLGLVFFVFGLNGFLGFLPQPPLEGPAAAFMGGLAASGYFFPFLKATEIVVGALLLSRRLVPLALVVLAPIALNILAFHALLAPAGLPLALAVVALGSYLAWTERAAYRPLFGGVELAREPLAQLRPVPRT